MECSSKTSLWIYNYLTWRMYDSANSAVTHSSTFLSLQKLALCKTMRTTSYHGFYSTRTILVLVEIIAVTYVAQGKRVYVIFPGQLAVIHGVDTTLCT